MKARLLIDTPDVSLVLSWEEASLMLRALSITLSDCGSLPASLLGLRDTLHDMLETDDTETERMIGLDHGTTE